MIKQRPYRPSATPPTAAPAPRTDEPTAGKDTAGRHAAGKDIAGKDIEGKDAAKGIELGKQIGHKLKAMFEDVVAEPVPEKFRALLEELERKSGKS